MRKDAPILKYEPTPIATEDVELPRELLELTERLAGSTHDRWARLRMDEGWTLGPMRDDEKKTHPGLVPYDSLPESEKEFDRQTAMETIKALLVLGWRLLPPDGGAPIGPEPDTETW